MRLNQVPRLALVLSGINLLIALCGTIVALQFDDEEALRRTGAVLAAMTGLFVIWQVLEEMGMERRLHENPSPDHGAEVPLLPIERTASRLKSAARIRHEREIRISRLRIVGVIAFWVCVGELLHGFGDIVYRDCREVSMQYHAAHPGGGTVVSTTALKQASAGME